MKTKGMRDIPTIQGLNKQAVPTTRPQAATELSRLEHEKVRLGRELKMWIDNQKRAEGRLRRVEERIVLVKQVLVQPDTDGSTKRARVRRSLANNGEREKQSWQEIALEY